MSVSWDSDSDSSSSHSNSSYSSFDEDEVNFRVKPCWLKYRKPIEAQGYRLDTCKDVKEFYLKYNKCQPEFISEVLESHIEYANACSGGDEDALCKDAGLPDNLFRGSRICDGAKIMVKAVHLLSREFDIIRFLSTAPQKYHSMNHCIPVLDLIEIEADDIGLIVMEEWSSQLVSDTPCSLRLFLRAIRQCVEHTTFMHLHNIAHLDISIRNLLTDFKSNYACIDYEISRRFDGVRSPRISGYRGTEVPPECDRGESSDPYKVDVWALGVLILRASQLTGYHTPELLETVKRMVHVCPNERPNASEVLEEIDTILTTIPEERLNYQIC